MKQNLAKLTVAVLIALFGSVTFWIPANATSPDFTVNAILPESQSNQEVSYFDLHLNPSQKETIQVEVSNNSDQAMELEVGVNAAVTNMNGVIDYSVSDQEPDPSLVVPFSSIAKTELNQVTLESNESKIISISIEMPDTPIEGIILGGITISEKQGEGETTGQVTNVFSYSIAVVISQESTELDSLTKLTKVQVEQRNRRNVVVASIQNPIAKIMNDVSVDGKVYKGKQTDPLYHTTRSDMRMAPNSTLDFGVTTNDKKLSAGTYRLVLVVTSGEDSWTFEEEFDITSEQAKELNETAVNLATDNTAMYLWIAGGMILVLAIVSGVLIAHILKKKQGAKENEKK